MPFLLVFRFHKGAIKSKAQKGCSWGTLNRKEPCGGTLYKKKPERDTFPERNDTQFQYGSPKINEQACTSSDRNES